VSDKEMPTAEKLAEDFRFPMVLKLPESFFSMGVFKVNDMQFRIAANQDLDVLEHIEIACFDNDRLSCRCMSYWIKAENGI
jgi:glutathione synthase/RimK-type ligase-like ATP-grasp enzyme